MPPRIKQLSPIVANQIAAGEVIERPASVVKELLENSLDAGSTHIEITIHKGGKNLIKITDNGSGIAPEDLPLALTRHATSKISSVEDLTGIISLGFRGEALASIASVSQLILTSAIDNEAWQITVTGDAQQPTLTRAAHPQGTTIEVHDLFFNTPVRRKFLSSDRTEYQHIENVVQRIALSHNHIAFKFTHDDREIFNLPAAFTEQQKIKRLEKLCGKNFATHSIAVLQQAEGLQLSGWLLPVEHSRAYSDLQYFFLNGRMVRDKVIQHALRSAAQDVIPPGRHLGYVLYLQSDPKTIDVNVHPTKHEVRFQQPRLIHDFIASAVVQQLQPVELFADSDHRVREMPAQYNTRRSSGFLGHAICQLKQQYLLTETAQGLMIIDLPKALQLLYLQQINQQALIAQPLLLPQTVKLTADAIAVLSGLNLTPYGIEWQPIAVDKIVVKALPEVLKNTDLNILLQKIIAADNLPSVIAAHAATEPPEFSTATQQTLIAELEKLSLPNHCYQYIELT